MANDITELEAADFHAAEAMLAVKEKLVDTLRGRINQNAREGMNVGPEMREVYQRHTAAREEARRTALRLAELRTAKADLAEGRERMEVQLSKHEALLAMLKEHTTGADAAGKAAPSYLQGGENPVEPIQQVKVPVGHQSDEVAPVPVNAIRLTEPAEGSSRGVGTTESRRHSATGAVRKAKRPVVLDSSSESDPEHPPPGVRRSLPDPHFQPPERKKARMDSALTEATPGAVAPEGGPRVEGAITRQRGGAMSIAKET
ncbi:hypothetical protein LTR53_016500 [Teratosphaeriaceae sp. CCFEE 6253]|nr:hypothetical protein LTR53_016500 [Teratosphaeriaceae sp. CCFEE 6253]